VTQTLTQEFEAQFEAERTQWLRRRVLWYFGVLLALSTLFLFLGRIQMGTPRDASEEVLLLARLIDVFARAGSAVTYLAGFLVAWRIGLRRSGLLALVFWIIVLGAGVTMILLDILLLMIPAEQFVQGEIDGETIEAGPIAKPLGIAAANLWTIGVTHIIAALFIPWSAREAWRPVLPLLGVHAIFVLIAGNAPIWLQALLIAGSPVVALPGVFICLWRHSRFRQKFHLRALRGRYGQVKQELMDARRIHESLFPAPIEDAALSMRFVYEPALQIGGDFLFVHRFPGLPGEEHVEPLSVVVLDVTGHGVAAALTVNRLSGELDRLFAEDPDISPGGVLAALNRYIHFTLAPHSVYATAFVARVDPRDASLAWASGGHPPALLVGPEGGVERLASTAFVLGACDANDFDPDEQVTTLRPGQRLLAYTDGAIEALDAEGRMLRVDGMERLVVEATREGGDGRWIDAVRRRVDGRRAGSPDDDTLLVEILRRHG